MKPFRPKSKRSSRRTKKRRPINVLASVLTAMGLYCGVRSIFEGIAENYETAAYFILGAIVFDILDGSVAKLTNSVSEFGKQLDSLADLVSFGVAPAVLIYTAYLHEETVANSMIGRTGSMMAVVFVMCGWLRLARFNVYQSDMRGSFIGLPIPAAGGTVASFVIFTHYFELNVAFWVLGPLTMALAYLMVSNVRYPKDRVKAFVLAPKSAFRTLAICAVVIGFFHYALTHSFAIVLFPMGAAYVSFGVAETITLHALRRRRGTDQESESSSPEVDTSEPNTGDAR